MKGQDRASACRKETQAECSQYCRTQVTGNLRKIQTGLGWQLLTTPTFCPANFWRCQSIQGPLSHRQALKGTDGPWATFSPTPPPPPQPHHTSSGNSPLATPVQGLCAGPTPVLLSPISPPPTSIFSSSFTSSPQL